MSNELRPQKIQQWCGKTSYNKGMVYYRGGKVNFTVYDDRFRHYEADVQIRSGVFEHAALHLDDDGEVRAHCTCPTLASYQHYCQHIAAVMIHVYESNIQGTPPPLSAPQPGVAGSDTAAVSKKKKNNGAADSAASHNANFSSAYIEAEAASSSSIQSKMNETELTTELLQLFSGAPRRPAARRRYLETRDELTAEFICRPVAYGNGQYRLGIEMKAGPKRTFVIRHIRQLLDSIRLRETYPLSTRFSYDPELHSFTYEDHEVIRQLIAIAEDEQPDSEARSAGGGDRLLIVPVSYWEGLLSALRRCSSVRVITPAGKEGPLMVQEGPLPLHFELDRVQLQDSEQRYQLRIRGLKPLVILETYSAVLDHWQLFTLDEDLCRRLNGLQQLLQYAGETGDEQHLSIPQEQLEAFVGQVVPGLMKLGHVQMTRRVSDRIVQTPLQARLYLDRIRDRLLAGLEFQYGDVILNPLEPEHTEAEEQGRILLRDGEREAQILQIMEEASFTATEGGYFLTDEEAEYEFLYHIVPRLEKLVHVYATSVVKAMIQNPLSPPRLTVHSDHRHDWLDFTFQLDGIPEAAIVEVLQSMKEQRRYHRLPSGAFLPLEDEEFKQIADFIRRTGMAVPEEGMQEDTGVLFRLPMIYGVEMLDVRDENAAIRFDRSVRRLLESLHHPDRHEEPVPAALDPILRDYQHYGYQWMRTLARYGFGGILADDMGLGKTLQSITFILSMLEDIRSSGRPALIVTPSSLTYNWQYELNRFAPELRVQLIDGSKSVRTVQWQHVLEQEPGQSHNINDPVNVQKIQQNSSFTAKDQYPVDVIITSYPLLRRDIELAGTHAYHTLIMDEAQSFKNALTQTARAVKKVQAKYRFALTGTPIENSVYELWSIMNMVMPKLLGTRKEFADLAPETIARRIKPFILRRMKTDVLHELPDKQEITLVSELHTEQKTLYAAYLAQLQQDALEHLYEKNFAEHQIRILAGLTRLRQLCCDPGLFVEGYEGGSAKLEQLLELVQDYRDSGRRMLIFSQFTSMLGRIGEKLREQQIPYFYLDGSTPSADRLELCNRFNAGENEVFLISLKAGGTGLNLTGADTVILYDLWWNPAVEEQAADRAHRMGQRRKVQVIRLVARGTVEEKMLALQQTKRDLIDEIIQPGQTSISTLSEQDIRELLMI